MSYLLRPCLNKSHRALPRQSICWRAIDNTPETCNPHLVLASNHIWSASNSVGLILFMKINLLAPHMDLLSYPSNIIKLHITNVAYLKYSNENSLILAKTSSEYLSL